MVFWRVVAVARLNVCTRALSVPPPPTRQNILCTTSCLLLVFDMKQNIQDLGVVNVVYMLRDISLGGSCLCVCVPLCVRALGGSVSCHGCWWCVVKQLAAFAESCGTTRPTCQSTVYA